MKIYIYSISDSDKHFASIIDEYIKRLPKTLLQIINIKPYKSDSHILCINKDTENMISKIKDIFGLKILLSKDGKTFSTEDLLNIYTNSLNSGQNIIFIIGGPYGLNEEMILKHSSNKISFGKITVPHGLAKVIILEQVYRIEQIRTGKDYHY